MALTRKHYVGIAQAVAEARYNGTDEAQDAAIDTVALRLARYLGEDNPRFDRERFLAATRGGAA